MRRLRSGNRPSEPDVDMRNASNRVNCCSQELTQHRSPQHPMNEPDRISRIRSLLESAFLPQELRIRDDSHLHAGHAGAREGKGHYAVKIVSRAFEGRRRLECHQMIYAALGDMMQTDIHALSISAESPRPDPGVKRE